MMDVAAFAPTFLELTLKVTVVLAAGHLLALLFRKASASSRHLVWAATVAGALLLAPLILSLPWRWDVVDLPAVAGPPAQRTGAADAAPPGGPPSAGSALPPASPSAPPGGAPPPWSPGALLLGLWLGGVGVGLVPLLRGARALRRLRRTGRPSADPELDALAAGAAGRLDVRKPRILLSDGVGAPLTSGLFRPAVILPTAATEWSAARRETVLLHELAHVRRGDLAMHLLARLACALYWFHPLAWTAARRLRAESERACDDHVLRHGAPPSRYAADLLELAGAGRGRTVPSFIPSMARTGDFEGRLLAILDATRRRGPESRRKAAAAGLLGAATVGVVAVLGGGPAEAVGADDAVPAGGADAPATVAAPADGTSPTAGAAPAGPGSRTVQGETAEAPPAVATALVRLLEDPDREVRASAARALGDRDALHAVDALIRALSDGSRKVRRSAAIALGAMDAAPAVGALSTLALEDPEPRVRSAAVWALGETEEEVAVEALARVVGEAEDRDLRRQAIAALGETGRPEAVAVLEGLVEDSGRRTLRNVLDALAELGPVGGDAVLVAVMGSDDARLRAMAAEALAESGR